ncbi:MAG: hypothetical protein JW863_01795 [Chitinispirillaceae bacterium]|nr:hypothetical protein [Chitinispirillaceae bacterium]
MMKTTVILTFCALTIACTPVRRIDTYIAATIPVVDEKLSLSPIISEVETGNLPDWPSNPDQQKILLKTFNTIWLKLLSEFRRCQKYGLYTMVEDNDNPTIRISVTITAMELTGDTLSMPIRLQAERLRDDQRFSYTLPVKAKAPASDPQPNPFHYYGKLFSDYARSFPYKVLVSYFYEHKLE